MKTIIKGVCTLLTTTLLFTGCSQDDDTTQSSYTPPTQVSGNIPMLVILLEYNNQPIVSDETIWANKMFGFGEKQLNGYYWEVSRQSFAYSTVGETYGVANNGLIKVHLDKNHINTDVDVPEFISLLANDLNAAIHAADPYIDFSLYDADGNGYITPRELTIVYIVAGYEDSYEGQHVYNGIWAHQASLPSDQAPVADGVKLFDNTQGGKYAVFGERHDIYDPHDATIGVIAHELGHASFNLPDLYNTVGIKGGIGYFGLMGAGSWTQKAASEFPGDTPTHLCAWSKSYLGWVTPIELHDTSTTLIQSASTDYNVIKIPINSTEYYLLENRADSGFDRGLRSLEGYFQGGIALWRINTDKLTPEHFAKNDVNAITSDKGVDIVEARNPIIDYIPYSGGSAEALFYNPNRTEYETIFSNVSAPSAVMNITIH